MAGGASWQCRPGGAAFPLALEQVCPQHICSALTARKAASSKLGDLLHKRMQGHRETGAKLTASVSTQDCMWRAAAYTYHMAGKRQTGQSPSPLHSSSSLTKADVSLQTDSQACKRPIPPASPITSSVWITLLTCESLKAMHCLEHKIRVKCCTSRSK